MKAAASRPLRYLLVGAFNTVAGYAIFAACVLALREHLPHGAILVLAHVLAVTLSFTTHGALVFEDGAPRGATAWWRAWWRCQWSYAGLLVLGLALNAAFIVWWGLSVWWAQALAMPVAIVAGWFVNRHVVFGRA